MTAVDIVTLVVAIIGAITGILATVLSVLAHRRELDKDRVKLRVGVSWGMSTADMDSEFLVIHATNLSSFPVTIREAGLMTKDGKFRVITIHARAGQGRLPIRLEPRTSVSVSFPPDFLLSEDLDSTSYAYVSTDCGEEVKAGQREIPLMIEEARKRAGA